jgi:hypothetical protein
MKNAITLPGSCGWTDDMNLRKEPDGQWSRRKLRLFNDELSYLCSGEGNILCRIVSKKRKRHSLFLESRKAFK